MELLDQRNIEVSSVDFVRFTWLNKKEDQEIEEEDDDDDDDNESEDTDDADARYDAQFNFEQSSEPRQTDVKEVWFAGCHCVAVNSSLSPKTSSTRELGRRTRSSSCFWYVRPLKSVNQPRTSSGYDINICEVRIGDARPGCSEVDRHPFEYPCERALGRGARHNSVAYVQ